jgi:hypothetical protein
MRFLKKSKKKLIERISGIQKFGHFAKKEEKKL